MKKSGWIGGVLPGIIFIISMNVAQAQFTTAVGARIGGTTGITFKHVVKKAAIEGIVGMFENGFSVTALLEHQKTLGVQGLYAYYGGGIHIASYDGSEYTRVGREVKNNSIRGVGAGIDGIIGLEYRLPRYIPIAFSIDLKPFVETGEGGYVGFAIDPSVSIKFVLK